MHRLPCCLHLAALMLSACTTPNPFAPVDASGGSASDETGDASGGSAGDPTTGAGPSTGDDPTGADTSASHSTDDGPTTNGPTGESSGNPAVPCECEALPAVGWTGPFRLETSSVAEPAPGCGDGWETLELERFEGIEAPPASCGCSCDDAVGVTCSSDAKTLHQYGAAAPICFGNTQTRALTPGGCRAISPAVSNGVWQVIDAPSTPQGGSCMASATVQIQPPTFTTRYTLCGAVPPPSGECVDGEQCLPAADAPLCIAAEGDVECPGGGYPVKHVVHDEIVDTRACSECSCSAPQGVCAGADGSGVVFNSPACGSSGPIDVEPNTCEVTTLSSVYYPESSIPIPEASCSASGSNGIGGAVGRGATTLCCNG